MGMLSVAANDALAEPTADQAKAAIADHRRRVAGWAALSIDVESDPAKEDRIFRIGVARSDTDASLDLAIDRLRADAVTQRIDAIAARARVLVGHNLRRHDLPALGRQFPALSCLELPLIDTLEWSALAFPANPYHRLVKGYKLASDTRNNPLRDARITLDLLGEEVEAFAEMHRTDPDWVALLHFLVVDDGPLGHCLAAIRTEPAPSPAQARQLAIKRFKALGCRTRLKRILAEDLDSTSAQGFDLALALGWIRVAGGNSVLPVWVNQSMPGVRQLVAELREQDCGQPDCRYCREQHDLEHLLSHYFGHAEFRPEPTAPNGTSLQRAIVTAGLARTSLLAVLPTGGGKSICYQLPALVHYWRTGQLTVIVSPLQSLMKDQVDNLIKAGVSTAVTINGLLTPLERRAALDKVRLGDAGIVLVSPEQFRSRSFIEAINLREIATWVFDEAHCLSKWGHDFRTDYLYVARFIRERFARDRQADRPITVACFTATAKPDVIDDLCSHFREALGIELAPFLGGHKRRNLDYDVIPATRSEKPQRIVELLQRELRHGGAAVVFCATRRTAETVAELVTAQGIRCGCFHGGLAPETKKEVQQQFLAGELAVIAATNAFGMGVDKPDIRVVIHAQIPGSLENYLQEAGRAGRDGGPARCILLFDPEDVETQFRLSASSKLTQKAFTVLLRTVRQRASRFKRDEIVVSAKELLAASGGTDFDIDIDAPDATTKVTTAVAWLERGGFLQRNENNTRVFPASLRVDTLAEACRRIDGAGLARKAHQQYVAIATALFRNPDPAGVSTDELMLDAGISPQQCFRVLHQLEALGILANDLGISVRLAKGVTGAADRAFERLDRLERALLELMIEQAPDADTSGEPQVLSIRPFCTELRRRLATEGDDIAVTPGAILACLRSLSENFGSTTERRGLLRVRGREAVTLVLHQTWPWIRDVCERRRAVAQTVLGSLLATLPAEARGADLIVECKARDLLAAIEADLDLRYKVTKPDAALEHALLYLHDNGVLQLDRGRSVFRSAMTIRLDPEAAQRRFLKQDFAPLEAFYRERTLQTHVMHEYARLGADDRKRARALVDGYFRLPRRRFIQEYFKGRADLLELATTDESFRRIVDDLAHPVQQQLVEGPERGNHLVLAGPGSGKTRVIVHRIAYLLRVRRVSPDSIIALAFNRGAAAELRRRLIELAGDDARRVAVLTYHAMALRLTGTSLEAASRLDVAVDFDRMIRDAIDLLNGKSEAFLDADEARDSLLQGYEYIFVDEYQDIDAAQYELVSALAGRRSADGDARLNIMAVGDDDQNIYAFKGANVEFIRRFQADYPGEVTYLVENFRSTQNIIAAANHVIQRAENRMKVDHPIRINATRAQDPAGGLWGRLDAIGHGRVRSIAAPSSANLQAQVVMQEVRRILTTAPATPLGQIAVLARTNKALEPMRALCEELGMRAELVGGDSARRRVTFMELREGERTVKQLPAQRSELVELAGLRQWLAERAKAEPDNPHWVDIADAVEDFGQGSEVERAPVQEVLDTLHEAAREHRRNGRPDALRLITAHGAKGLEFEHVIVMDCRDWGQHGDDERRLLYVAMTRAKATLVVMRAEEGGNVFLMDLGSVEGVMEALPDERPRYRRELERRYKVLGPAEVDLGYAGRLVARHPVHDAIARLRVGDRVRIEGREIVGADGVVVGRLARRCEVPEGVSEGTVIAVMVRGRAQTPDEYQAGIKVDGWEVALVEVVGGD